MLFIAQPLDYFHSGPGAHVRALKRPRTFTQVSKFTFVEPYESLFWSAVLIGARSASDR